MNRIHCAHAQPTFAFRHKPLTLNLFVPDREVAVADIALRYSVSLSGGNGGAQGLLAGGQAVRRFLFPALPGGKLFL